jgi:c-di-GMP-binding flagellar brake protein YcgR
MSEQAATEVCIRLADMDLRIGQTVQLISLGQHQSKYFTRLIGYVEGEFIMLRVPMEKGWTVPLEAGLKLQVRVFFGVSLYEFETRLETVLLHPRNYMLLSCPEQIRSTRLRAHERAKCALPVQVLQSPVGGADQGFVFQDLSGGGAALLGPKALGEPGQQIEVALEFLLAATGSHERVVLDAEIQTFQALRDQAGQASGYLHGIRFAQSDPRVWLLVSELLKPGSR